MTELPPGASPVDAIEPGTRLREWEIVRFVGRGSYGVVFEARRSSWLDEPPRALKIFDPIVSSAARSALLGEFSTLTDVHHPHLLAGIDAFDLVEPPYAGCVVFVLELADEDLSHRVARSGALPPAEAAAVVADVAEQLDPGGEALVLRGALERESLHLAVVNLPTPAHRLAWLADRDDEAAGRVLDYAADAIATMTVQAIRSDAR